MKNIIYPILIFCLAFLLGSFVNQPAPAPAGNNNVPCADCAQMEKDILLYIEEQQKAWEGVEDATTAEIFGQLLHGISEGDYQQE